MNISSIFNKIIFWFNNSRPYTIPITLLSWLVIFLYSLKDGGNLLYGIVAYVGIFIVHLATNLADDYFDFIRLSKNPDFLSKAKDSKCKYLKNGDASLRDLKYVLFLMFLCAFLIGCFLFCVSGWKVVYFAALGFIIAVFYSKFSQWGIGDIAVILAYGPIMFEGVYYVMTGNLSLNILLLSLSCSVFVNSILYTSMILDYDEDFTSNKKTLAIRSGSKNNALNILIFYYVIGYLLILYFGIKDNNFYYFISLIILPLIFDLYKSLKIYNENKTILPKINLWNYPLDNWERIKNEVVAPYFLRFYYVRNIAVLFLIFVCISILVK